METPGNYKHAIPEAEATGKGLLDGQKEKDRGRERERGMILAEEVHSRQSRGVSDGRLSLGD